MSPSTSPCGFPGDAFVGFACGLLCTAGKFWQTQVPPSWMSSSHIDFASSVQPQKLSLPTPTVCPSVLYPCADHLAKGIHVSDVTQYPGNGLLDGDCVPTPTDNSTPYIVAVEMSPFATSLMLQVALLGCRDLTHSPIFHPPTVPVHAACAFIIHDQCVHFDPGGVLLIATIASCSKASDAVDPASLAALDVVDDLILTLLDDTDSTSDGRVESVGCPSPFELHHLHWPLSPALPSPSAAGHKLGCVGWLSL